MPLKPVSPCFLLVCDGCGEVYNSGEGIENHYLNADEAKSSTDGTWYFAADGKTHCSRCGDILGLDDEEEAHASGE